MRLVLLAVILVIGAEAYPQRAKVWKPKAIREKEAAASQHLGEKTSSYSVEETTTSLPKVVPVVVEEPVVEQVVLTAIKEPSVVIDEVIVVNKEEPIPTTVVAKEPKDAIVDEKVDELVVVEEPGKPVLVIEELVDENCEDGVVVLEETLTPIVEIHGDVNEKSIAPIIIE